MGSWTQTAVVAALAYLLGSVPFPLLVSRLLYGIDLREHGSGNMGALNTARVLGPAAGLLAGLLDAAKGALAAVLGLLLLGAPHGALLGGAGAAVGHVWPAFARGRGGKALAASAGALLAAGWPLLAQELALGVAAVAVAMAAGGRGRRVLLPAGLAMAAGLPPLVWWRWPDAAAAALATVWGAAVFWPHLAEAAGWRGRG